MNLVGASRQELADLLTALEADFNAMKARGLALDLTRGKPASEQLALSEALDGILEGQFTTDSGVCLLYTSDAADERG